MIGNNNGTCKAVIFNKGINIIETKKRRTDNGLEHDNIMGLNTEIGVGSDTEDVDSM